AEHAERPDGGRGQLVGMVEMGVDVEWMVLLEDSTKLGCHPLWQVAGGAAPDPKHLEVRNRAQARADLIDPAVREEQGIAARQDDVADLVVLLEIAKRRFEVRQRDLLGVADLAPARTEAAVGRAD